MTDHLPECHTAMIPDFHNERWICICAALRACEQRVEEAMDRAWTHTVALAVAHTRTTTLDAAREAIAEQKLVPLAKQGRFIITRNTQLWKQRQAWSELGWWDFRTSALAAMDALRQTTEVDNHKPN